MKENMDVFGKQATNAIPIMVDIPYLERAETGKGKAVP